MKKAIACFIGVLLLMGAFSLLIYPTPYRYLEFEYNDNGGKVPVKVNVITGKTQTFTQQFGWNDIKNQE